MKLDIAEYALRRAVAGQAAGCHATLRQTAQKPRVLLGKNAFCPQYSLVRIDVELLGKLRVTHGLVMVALNGLHPCFSGQFHALIGTGVVADEVTQIQDLICALLKVA